ncbi:DUF58 domain-containing protein [Gimesia chilikensis]|uniref:DUF58 domain-containing protein n=1 Tax=Gimesia chilikensis TaxID=2605989 RepID=A0A517PW75_9PLAN|nr:DUF58 domain-containing protein [Gimesia chilikensis]QDT23620.1 hypothetical protein HG66A1_54420 [Gimesia chilikensis]
MSAAVSITLEELILMKAEARGFSLLPRQPVTSLLAGRHASRLRGRGLTFEELRHYHEGDDVRSIDWRATARLRSPHVRVFSEERERPVLFVVDQRLPMFFGSRRAMKSVVAAELAALGAWRSLEVGDRVGGLVFNESEVVEIRPHRSRTRVLRLFHEIVNMNQRLASEQRAEGSVTLNNALEKALHVAKHDCLVVLISDLDGADAETRRLSTLISARNDMLVAAVYDPLGATLSGAPGMLAADRGELWEIPSHAAFTDQFRQAFQERVDEWQKIFRNLKVPVMPVSTSLPAGPQVLSLLGHRARHS